MRGRLEIQAIVLAQDPVGPACCRVSLSAPDLNRSWCDLRGGVMLQ